jgi:hypothetical protein
VKPRSCFQLRFSPRAMIVPSIPKLPLHRLMKSFQ